MHSIDNSSLWIVLQKDSLEFLLKKAKEFEKKYEWLQAAKIYKEASNLVLKEKAFLKAAEFQEKLGFCFYRTALQAKTNINFKKTIKKSILAHEKESKILEEKDEEKYRVKIIHANALTAYLKSWHESDSKKKNKLLKKSSLYAAAHSKI